MSRLLARLPAVMPVLRTVAQSPKLYLAAAQILAGIALLIDSESAAAVAQQLFALGEGVAETGSLAGALGLVLSGVVTPLFRSSRASESTAEDRG